MKLILAIHPDYASAGEMQKFLKLQCRGKEKLYVIYFSVYAPSKKGSLMKRLFGPLAKELAGFKRLIALGPVDNEFTDFGGYDKAFSEKISLLKKKLGKGEKVKVMSFGGAAEGCYKRINEPAYMKIKEILGEGNVFVRGSYLPLMWSGFHPTANPWEGYANKLKQYEQNRRNLIRKIAPKIIRKR
ncbi:MAG: hypothetical protein V1676_01680 [Candidatus Diapherotrites archaeon]